MVVLRGPYILVIEEEPSPESAKLFMDRISGAAKAAGWNVIGHEKECGNHECLKAARESFDTEEAMLIRVQQIGARYELGLMLASGKTSEVVVTGPLTTVYEAVDDLVEKTLSELPDEEKLTVKEPSSVAPAGSADTGETPPAADSNGERRKRFSPGAFWTSLGLTAALAVGAATIEGVGYARLKKVNDKPIEERTQSDRDFQKSMRIAEAVLLGGAVVGTAITLVIGLSTEFNARNDKIGVFLLPAVDKTSGALVLKGEF
jgi:hypothetical protein